MTANALVVVALLSQLAAPSPAIRLAVLDGPLFDDFDGPEGAPPNPDFWDYDIWTGLRGELQSYTNAPENVRLDGEGHLIIQALQTPTGYTSAEILTHGKAEFMYGTVAARIQFPAGQGLLPAFWMVGADCPEVGWPQCGEIDIMELKNDATQYRSTLIGPAIPPEPGKKLSTAATGPVPDLTTDFHVYWVHRSVDQVSFGIDDTTNAVFTPDSLPPGGQWVFNKPMFALLNIAVGNPWTGPPDDSTQFPSTMVVDWFRYTPD